MVIGVLVGCSGVTDKACSRHHLEADDASTEDHAEDYAVPAENDVDPLVLGVAAHMLDLVATTEAQAEE